MLWHVGFQSCLHATRSWRPLSATDLTNNETVRHMSFTADGPIVSYQSVIGSTMYAMLGTRPDLAHAVGVLGRYSANPKHCHWESAK